MPQHAKTNSNYKPINHVEFFKTIQISINFFHSIKPQNCFFFLIRNRARLVSMVCVCTFQFPSVSQKVNWIFVRKTHNFARCFGDISLYPIINYDSLFLSSDFVCTLGCDFHLLNRLMPLIFCLIRLHFLIIRCRLLWKFWFYVWIWIARET